MKRILGFLAATLLIISCQDNDSAPTEFTGNETTYALVSGSTYPVNGTVTFREKLDGTTLVRVVLSGTEGTVKHPVHIHMGDLSAPDADVSALLNPIAGNTGISETTLERLADESAITYQQVIALNACVKIHLSDAGPDKNIILAAGNIGTASRNDVAGGRAAISVCKSE